MGRGGTAAKGWGRLLHSEFWLFGNGNISRGILDLKVSLTLMTSPDSDVDSYQGLFEM